MEQPRLGPNSDMRIWLRTCEEEVLEPLKGKVTGKVPSWLQGTLLRNGPGANKLGSSRFGHVFDGPALLHRFAIKNGEVTYQCRFICSETYKKNRKANRIVVTEFGTESVPDPCHTIFDRFFSYFQKAAEISDNSPVSVYPFGDEFYALTETPSKYVQRIDPKTLETLEQKVLIHSLLIHHTAHPHIDTNGDAYNVGIYMVDGNVKHSVVKFPYTKDGDMFESAEIAGTMTPRWKWNPAYMHSFLITKNYFVIIEQPLSLNIAKSFARFVKQVPFSSFLSVYADQETHIVLIHRTTGVEKRYRTDTVFFMHTINAYEQGSSLVMDVVTYDDCKFMDSLFTKTVESIYETKEYAKMWCNRPKRFVIPLEAPELTKIKPLLLADIACEMPTINYNSYNGKPYRYFYGVNTEVGTKTCGAIIKVDTLTGEVMTWFGNDCSSSEPVFVPSPYPKREDDGVLLSVILHDSDERSADLLILNSQTFEEEARVSFSTKSAIPKCFHGWYIPEGQFK